MFCVTCGNEIPQQYQEKVREYCVKNFGGRMLCYGCQQKEKGQGQLSDKPQSVPQDRTVRPNPLGNPRSDFEADVMAKLQRVIDLLEPSRYV
jgi:hypothetical protein